MSLLFFIQQPGQLADLGRETVPFHPQKTLAEATDTSSIYTWPPCFLSTVNL